MKLEIDRGGSGGRLLILLHGMGANRHVWQAMLARNRWEGTWIAPDLRGHGASAHAQSYALGLHAADVAETVGEGWREIVVLGHSMGGAIALALASGWFGIQPRAAFGLGIKSVWPAEDLAGLARMAAAPVRRFPAREEAAARYLKVAGLAVSDNPGIVQGEDGWHLAADPATAGIGAPPMKALIASSKATLHLARGESDAMVSLDQLREFDPRAVEIAAAGHNAMVEKPDAVWDWLARV